MSREPEIVTFGCRLNSYESEVVRAHARAAGLTDAVIVNTCGVTNEAVREARKAIRRARRRRPEAEIIVTGCAAQISPGMFADMPEVDRVLGNAEKMRAESYLAEASDRVAVADVSELRETALHLIDGLAGRARTFVEVQNGCDHDCTFCIIPRGRGPSRSVPVAAVVEQVRHLALRDCKEVVLTGVDTTSYGADLPGRPTLGRLVREILAAVPELPRLRLSSIDSVEVDDELFRAIAEEERLMPHLHFSLQAGDDLILRRMKRRHLSADAVATSERVRRLRPDVLLGADLIAGFPTESEEMFENTLRHVEDCGLTFLHVFPFSARETTPAARMPQVPGDVIRSRAARLRAAGEKRLSRALDGLVGTTAELLVEAGGRARTRSFATVELAGEPPPPGTLLPARLDGHDGRALSASPIR